MRREPELIPSEEDLIDTDARTFSGRKVLFVKLARPPRAVELDAFARLGLEVRVVRSAASAMRATHESSPDLILFDAPLSEADSADLLERLNRIAPDVRFIILDRDEGGAVAQSSDVTPARALLPGPLEEHRLADAVRAALEMDAPQQGLRLIESELREALRRGELRLEYQPIVKIADLGTVGFEALLRWDSPTLGSVSPQRFLPVAEELDLIESIEAWTIRAAVEQIDRWRRASDRMPWVSVNLSGISLNHADPAAWIRDALAASDTKPDYLVIEISEQVLREMTRRLEETIGTLRQTGVRLTADDFGTTGASIAYLRDVRVDHVKVDRLFLRSLDEAEDGAALLGSIIELARELGLRVIAEGVETVWQLDRLRDLGCDMAQGYLFGRAAPPAWDPDPETP
ncbi:MAG: EAL domain-containing response regulator [Gemmatimonadota bacterium]|nr:EAL domain-containing response regulator [Gemmatimonadota bacterium]